MNRDQQSTKHQQTTSSSAVARRITSATLHSGGEIPGITPLENGGTICFACYVYQAAADRGTDGRDA